MSRAYQIRVSESVVRTVHVEDGVASPLDLLPILPPDRMGDLLGHELEQRGFARDGHTATRTDLDGIVITVDLATAMVTVKLGAKADVAETIDLTARVGNVQAGEAALRDDAIRQLDDRIADRTEQLRREVTKKLEDKLADIRRELDEAIGRTTVAALTERANQLGSIQEIAEDEAGNVTIRVKV
jgi:hypothetical protein|nr:hypothetical protein [Kofleriaceae bacterium]